jgi:hypothetical protein
MPGSGLRDFIINGLAATSDIAKLPEDHAGDVTNSGLWAACISVSTWQIIDLLQISVGTRRHLNSTHCGFMPHTSYPAFVSE